MKKTLNYFLAAAVIMALGSCSKEIEKPNPSEKELVKVTVRAETADLASETRTALAEDGDLYWSYEDAISVFDGTGNREFTADISATDDPAKTAFFEGAVDPDATSFVALYPYDEDAEYASGKITTTIPAVQEAVVGSFANKSNVAVATGDKSNMDGDEDYAICQFAFKNIGALVKFTISQANAHKSVSVKVKNADGSFDSIAGAVEIVPATGIATVAATGGFDAVTVKAASGKLAAGDYYAVILPVSGSNKKLSFVLSDGNTSKTRTTKTAITVDRSSYIDMGTIDEGITYPDKISGSYLILSTKKDGNYYVMGNVPVNNKAWTAVDTEVPVANTTLDIENSSTNFSDYSNVAYKWVVTKVEGGFTIYNESTGLYLNPGSSSGNGTDSEDPVVLTVDRDGETGEGVVSGNNLSLQFNASAPRFTFYTKDTQRSIILVRYNGVATPCTLSVTCESNVVTMTANPSNAEIYYTLDGTDPTTSSTKYSEPFTITQDVSIKAKAFAPSSDYSDSDVVSKEFTYEDTSSYWSLVTDDSDLSSGDMIVIANFSKGKIASATITNGRLMPASGTTSFSASGSSITSLADDAAVFSLGGTSDAWTLTSSNGVLGATGAGKLAYDSSSGTSTWSISVTNSGDATIQNSNSEYGRFLYNVSSSWFTTYTSGTTTAMLLPQIYRRPDNRTSVSLSFSPAAPDGIALGDSFTEPTLTVNPSNAPVAYSISTTPSGIATIDSSTGKLSITAAGTITVTASVSDLDHFKPASASYTFEVSPAVSTIATILADNTVASNNKVPYKTDGVTVLAKQGTQYVIKDETGMMLMYYNGEALTLGNVYNVDGLVTKYNGVHEYSNPTVTVGTATAQSAGTPVSMSVSDVTTYISSPLTKYAAISFVAPESGLDASDGTNTIHVLDATNTWENYYGRALNVTGYLVGVYSGKVQIIVTEISVDESVPYLKTVPANGNTLIWEDGEFGSSVAKTVAVTTNNGASYSVISDSENKWTISDNHNGTITVYPNAINESDEQDKTFTLRITHGSSSTVFSEVILKQNRAAGSNPPTPVDVTYDFSKIDGFSNWSTTYGQHIVDYDAATVTFDSANRQTSTITNVPVTKGQPVSLVLKSGTLNSVTFICTQWGTKAQTITLHYSTDGGATYTSTGITSTNFTVTSPSLPTGTNAVKITFSNSSNQVGISSASINYTPAD